MSSSMGATSDSGFVDLSKAFASMSTSELLDAKKRCDLILALRQMQDAGKRLFAKLAIKNIEKEFGDLVVLEEKKKTALRHSRRKPKKRELGLPYHEIGWLGVGGLEVKFQIQLAGQKDSVPMISFSAFTEMIEHIAICGDVDHCPPNFTPYTPLTTQYPLPGKKGLAYWHREFNSVIRQWAQSDERKKLISVLDSCGNNIKNISKLICFGNGDFHPHGCDDHSNGNRSAFQHAAALTIQQFLQEKNGKEVALWAQDPYYTATVIPVLESHGFNVYKGVGRGSHGFVDVDDNCFVMSISCTAPVMAIIADVARPAIMMRYGYFKTADEELKFCEAAGIDFPLRTLDPVNGPVREMLNREYNELEFVTDKVLSNSNNGPFSGVCIYNRKLQASETHGHETGIDGMHEDSSDLKNLH